MNDIFQSSVEDLQINGDELEDIDDDRFRNTSIVDDADEATIVEPLGDSIDPHLLHEPQLKRQRHRSRYVKAMELKENIIEAS